MIEKKNLKRKKMLYKFPFYHFLFTLIVITRGCGGSLWYRGLLAGRNGDSGSDIRSDWAAVTSVALVVIARDAVGSCEARDSVVEGDERETGVYRDCHGGDVIMMSTSFLQC
jgi:hypothetical protein